MVKFRKGFVSNSSSSSFICDICGEEESGYDISLSDADMVMCENGHIICKYHLNFEDFDKDGFDNELKKYLDADSDLYVGCEKREIVQEYFDTGCKVKFLKENLIDVIHRGCNEKSLLRYFCPLCRFDKITNDALANYLIKKFNITREEIRAEIKERFTSYKEFNDYLESK